MAMDDSTCNLQIKQENDSEDYCSPSMVEACGQDSNSYLCVPKEEYVSENEMDTNDPEFRRDFDDFYEFFFAGKQELQELDTNAINEMEQEEIGVIAVYGSQYSDSSDSQLTDENSTPNINQKEDATTANKILLCPFCGEEFPNKSIWRQHLNIAHQFYIRENLNIELLDDNTAKCRQCKATFTGRTLKCLQDHKIKRLPFNRYVKCKLCEQLFADGTSYKLHIESVHGSNDFEESEDNSKETSWETKALFLCPFCGIVFQISSAWRKHLNDIHDFNKPDKLNMELFTDNTAKCKQCEKKINSQDIWHLQLHKLSHLPYYQYVKCRICSKKFIRTRNFIIHLEKMCHNRDPDESTTTETSSIDFILLCPVCGIEFPTSAIWTQHINDIHNFNKRETLNMEYLDNNTSKCKQCQKKLNSRQIAFLKDHKITHMPYSLYVKCKKCSKKFSRVTTVVNHLKKRHPITIVNEKSVPNELKSNSNNFLLLCPFCGIEFPNSYSWRQHVNDLHDFNKRESLNMKFLNDKKAECKRCKLVVTTALTSLQTHKITHLPYKRYCKCKLCKELFICPANLRRHFEMSHNIVK